MMGHVNYKAHILNCVITSHIGETYPEDERSQSRHGGYDPATDQ